MCCFCLFLHLAARHLMFADQPQHDAQEQNIGDGHDDDMFVRYCMLKWHRGAAGIDMECDVPASAILCGERPGATFDRPEWLMLAKATLSGKAVSANDFTEATIVSCPLLMFNKTKCSAHRAEWLRGPPHENTHLTRARWTEMALERSSVRAIVYLAQVGGDMVLRRKSYLSVKRL